MPLRRELLLGAGLAAAAPKKAKEKEPEVSPAEDLTGFAQFTP